MFLPRGLLGESGKGKKSHWDIFHSRASQSMCILTHCFDDTAFQKGRGSIRNIVRGEFAFLGVSLVSPCHRGFMLGLEARPQASSLGCVGLSLAGTAGTPGLFQPSKVLLKQGNTISRGRDKCVRTAGAQDCTNCI